MNQSRKKKEFTVNDLQSETERNRIAKELEPLMLKIVNQWDGVCPLDRELIEMQARYGIVYAMNHYREGTSQTFIQYAAWCMRNWILNGINEFGSTVRIGAGERKRLLDSGETVYRTTSLDRIDDAGKEDRNLIGEVSDKASYTVDFEVVTREEVISKLVDYVDRRFDKRHKDIFFSTYALKGKQLTKGVDLAKKYNCTAALISQLNREVLDKIREDDRLMELLQAVRTVE